MVIDGAQLIKALKESKPPRGGKMIWYLRRYLLFPIWVVAIITLIVGSWIAFAGQWFVILCEETCRLPDMPDDYRYRNGVEL